MEYEDAPDKEEEYDSTDREFRPRLSEEDGDGKDSISAVALDIFEVFDGEGECIGDEEEEEKWFRECL